MQPTTLAQKLVARASGRDHVDPGEIVTCRVDLAMSHDSSGPRRVAPLLDELGVKVWDPDKYVIITDHYVPATSADSAQILAFTRDWVKSAGIKNFHDEQGICHVVLPERGHIRPGMFIVGGDSHSPTAGAFGAYMFGVGATEMFGVLATGHIWLRVPETISIEWTGRFQPGVSAKDAMLFLCGQFGMDGGKYEALELKGPAIAALSMQERMTLSNMSAEFGAQAGLIAPDDVTRRWLADHGVSIEADEAERWVTDPGAHVMEAHTFNASMLGPQVAAPHSPANAFPVEALAGQPLDSAYIGACTGAKLEDLRMAATVLRGRRVREGLRLLVAPASLRDQGEAELDGSLAALRDAGAQVLPIGCGACAGYGDFRFGEGERVISSTARNFQGRMGANSSMVWLSSPFTVAASALAGCIADPRPLLLGRA